MDADTEPQTKCNYIYIQLNSRYLSQLEVISLTASEISGPFNGSLELLFSGKTPNTLARVTRATDLEAPRD